MNTIYKVEKIKDRLEASKVLAATKGSWRNIISQRCILCNLLFETLKMYRKQVCILCRIENRDSSYIKMLIDQGHTKEEIYKNAIKKHYEIDLKKDQIAKATKCTITHKPICLRIP